MARLTNLVTGVVVSVDDARVAQLGSEWSTDGKSLRASARGDEPDESWKVADLKAYADENGVDLGEATKKADILEAINAAGDDDEAGDEPDES